MTPPLIQERLVLPPDLDSLSVMQSLAERLAWRWAARIPEAPQQLHEEIWELPDEQVQVRYINDRYVNTRLLLVCGENGESVYRVLHSLARELSGARREDLLDMVSSEDHAERIHGLSGLAASVTLFDIEVFEAVVDALGCSDVAIEECAFYCITRLAWFEFAAELDKRAAQEHPGTSSTDKRGRTLMERMQELAKDIRARH